MDITYKGFKGKKVVDDGKELIVLAGEELEDLVWIEDDEIRATNIEPLEKILVEYKVSNIDFIQEDFHPGLTHYIVDIKNL
jgi:hypothetical protein